MKSKTEISEKRLPEASFEILPAGTTNFDTKNENSNSLPQNNNALHQKCLKSEPYHGFDLALPRQDEYLDHQIPNFIPKSGILLCVVPQGSVGVALTKYFAQLLSGQNTHPFGQVLYPGNVLVLSPSLGKSDLHNQPKSIHSTHGAIYCKQTERYFNWRIPKLEFEEILSQHNDQTISSIIIDAGVLSKGIDAAIVETAEIELKKSAFSKQCVIIIVLESHLSKSINLFEKIPHAVSNMQNKFVICKTLDKNNLHLCEEKLEFTFSQLSRKSHETINATFSITPSPTNIFPDISWGRIFYKKPAEFLREIEFRQISQAKRQALTFIIDTLRINHSLTLENLQAFASTQNIARTTVRDTLTLACSAGYVAKFKNQSDKKTYWHIPSFTQQQSISYQKYPPF